jgi:hypothetical protein
MPSRPSAQGAHVLSSQIRCHYRSCERIGHGSGRNVCRRWRSLSVLRDSKDLRGKFDPPHLFLASVDLADPALAQAKFSAADACLGGIDTLVNVAGGFRWGDHRGWQGGHLGFSVHTEFEDGSVCLYGGLPVPARSPGESHQCRCGWSGQG